MKRIIQYLKFWDRGCRCEDREFIIRLGLVEHNYSSGDYLVTGGVKGKEDEYRELCGKLFDDEYDGEPKFIIYGEYVCKECGKNTIEAASVWDLYKKRALSLAILGEN